MTNNTEDTLKEILTINNQLKEIEKEKDRLVAEFFKDEKWS